MTDTGARTDLGAGFRAERGNPYQSYAGAFTDFFDFGAQYRRWVEDCMLDAMLGGGRPESSFTVADVGAGTCQWTQRLLRRVPHLRALAVEPSSVLLEEQRVPTRGDGFDVSERIDFLRATAQEFAERCAAADSPYRQLFDCIYFMQSAHYIHSSDFVAVMRRLRSALRPAGKLVLQARNLNADWWPWPFPEEWHPRVVAALEPLHRLADRYEAQLGAMDEFTALDKWSRSIDIAVPAASYWQRLAARWIPSLMSEAAIPDPLLHHGIDAMRRRYEQAGKDTVTWTDTFTIVIATTV